MTEKKKMGKEKEMVTRDIRVSEKIWGFMYTIANEVRVATGRRCTPNEILTANKPNITTKAVLEKRKQEEEKSAVAEEEGGGEEKNRKTLLEVAIKDKEKREGKEEEK